MIIGTIDFAVLLISGDKTMKNSVEATERKKRVGRWLTEWEEMKKKWKKINWHTILHVKMYHVCQKICCVLVLY